MKIKTVIFLLAIILTGCVPAMTPAQTVVPPTFTPTVKATIAVTTPTQIPQTFIPVITPDAIQVARWKEYERALASK